MSKVVTPVEVKQGSNRDRLHLVFERPNAEGRGQGGETEARMPSHLIIRNKVAFPRPARFLPPFSPCSPSFSLKSPDMSRLSLTSEQPWAEEQTPPNVSTFICSLTLFSAASVIQVAIGLLVLDSFLDGDNRGPPGGYGVHQIQGNAQEADASPSNSSSNGSCLFQQELSNAGIALTSFVLTAGLYCLLVCSMQCLFVAKILNLPDGQDRAYKYLRECSSTRNLALTGFFMSIPALLVDLVILLLLRLPSHNGLVGAVLLGVGVLFCALAVIQNFYHWRVERSRASQDLPVYDSRLSFPKCSNSYNSPRRRPELCTLV